MSVASGVALFVSLSVHVAETQQAANIEPDAPPSQTFALADTKDLVEQDVKAEAVEYRGRKAIRLTTQAEDGLAFVQGTQFRDGTIDVDVATKTTAPPGARMPGFTGIAFRARPDGSHFEMFYLRPGNSKAEDQAMRNHSVQYTLRLASVGRDCEDSGHLFTKLMRSCSRRSGPI